MDRRMKLANLKPRLCPEELLPILSDRQAKILETFFQRRRNPLEIELIELSTETGLPLFDIKVSLLARIGL